MTGKKLLLTSLWRERSDGRMQLSFPAAIGRMLSKIFFSALPCGALNQLSQVIGSWISTPFPSHFLQLQVLKNHLSALFMSMNSVVWSIRFLQIHHTRKLC